MTSAFCVYGRIDSKWIGRAGHTNTKRSYLYHTYSRVQHRVATSIHQHPSVQFFNVIIELPVALPVFSDFDPRNIENDIAVMFFGNYENDFEYTDYVRPICLPQPNFTFNGGYMLVSGQL